MSHFMKKPCEHCPFRRDVKPFLHPKRGEELAYAAQNHYNSFSCHKTTVPDEESEESNMLVTETSKECAGFLTLVANECGEDVLPEGFKPSYELCYTDSFDMVQAYEDPEEDEDEEEEED